MFPFQAASARSVACTAHEAPRKVSHNAAAFTRRQAAFGLGVALASAAVPVQALAEECVLTSAASGLQYCDTLIGEGAPAAASTLIRYAYHTLFRFGGENQPTILLSVGRMSRDSMVRKELGEAVVT